MEIITVQDATKAPKPNSIDVNQSKKRRRYAMTCLLLSSLIFFLLVFIVPLIITSFPEKSYDKQMQRTYMVNFKDNIHLNIVELTDENQNVIISSYESLYRIEEKNKEIKEEIQIEGCQNLIKIDFLHNTTDYYFKCGLNQTWLNYENIQSFQQQLEPEVINIQEVNLIDSQEIHDNQINQFFNEQFNEIQPIIPGQTDKQHNQSPQIDKQQQGDEENNTRNLKDCYYAQRKYCILDLQMVCIPYFKCYTTYNYYCQVSVQCYQEYHCHHHVKRQVCNFV